MPSVERSDTAPSSAPSFAASISPSPRQSPTTPAPSIASGLPAGWLHELTCRNGDSTGCQLHLYDAVGREQPGWPVPLAGGCWSDNFAVATDGVAYVACKIDDQLTVINSVAVTGSTRAGWPVDVPGYPDGRARRA